jgi:hypothetical protein
VGHSNFLFQRHKGIVPVVIHDRNLVSYDVVVIVSIEDQPGDLDYTEVSMGMQLAFGYADCCTLVGSSHGRPSYLT